ncbi:MAG: hypothetical protein WCE90_10300 [Candidatus Zixiibacteriota bacterium]
MGRQGLKTCCLVFLLAGILLAASCSKKGTSPSRNETYSVDANGIPKFAAADYIEIQKIHRISKFRSSVGHSYWDDFESCRSLKHYFEPRGEVDWSTIKIFSPVKGTVSKLTEEWAGTQVQIRSTQYPAFYFIIFHINLANPLKVGDAIDAGQQLGTHIGPQTMSDIAVGVNTPGGWKLVSYFSVMTDSVFQRYQLWGVSSRDTMIISKQARDADTLVCDGETITNSGSLENWITLRDDIYDVDADGIPKFTEVDYIELDKIYSISKFRSSVGHSYSDNFESCRSMKHYFQAKDAVDWSAIKIFSPVQGTVFRMIEEWAGTQVQIQSTQYPAFCFIIFHINLAVPLEVGDVINAGQQLGTHIGSQTYSDIAVAVNTPGGWKLVSYFDVMTDWVFQGYQARGVSSREALIISKQARDADTLTCNGEAFANSGHIENWVILN